MLRNQTVGLLGDLKLIGMAQAYARQLEQPAAQELSFDERLAMLVGAELSTSAGTGTLPNVRADYLRLYPPKAKSAHYGADRDGQIVARLRSRTSRLSSRFIGSL